MTDHKHATAGFWFTVALVAVLVGYPLSFGPACWVIGRKMLPVSAAAKAYWPLVLLQRGRGEENGLLCNYARIWNPSACNIIFLIGIYLDDGLVSRPLRPSPAPAAFIRFIPYFRP